MIKDHFPRKLLSIDLLIPVLVSLILGIAGIVSLAHRWSFFWKMTPTVRIFAAGLGIILAALLFFPVYHLVQYIRTTLPVKDIFFLTFFFIAFGFILRTYFSFLDPPLSPLFPFQLRIISEQHKNPASQGSEIGLDHVSVDGIEVPFSEFEREGNWTENGGILTTGIGQQGKLIYYQAQFPIFRREVWEFEFISGPSAGKVRLEPSHMEVDLYSPKPGRKRIPVVIYLHKFCYFSDSLWISFLFFLSGFLLMRWQKDESEKWTSWDCLAAASLAGIVFGICYGMGSRGSNFGFVDMAHDGYQLCTALDLQHGAVLFRDTFTQYGLLPDYMNAMGLNVFGPRLFSLKMTAGLFYAAILFSLYFIARSFLPRFPAFITGLIYTLIGPYWFHGVMVSAHIYCVLFQALSVLLILRGIYRSGWVWVWGAGVATGLMFGMKQNVGFYHLVALFGFFLLFRLLADDASTSTVRMRFGRFLRDALILLTGFACVMLVFLGWLVWQGALKDWWIQTILLPSAYTIGSSGTSALPGAIPPGATLLLLKIAGFFGAFIEAQIALLRGYDLDVWFIGIRIVILGIGLGEIILPKERNWGVILLAVTALFAWLGLVPSGKIMHQWGSLAVSFPVFPWLLWKITRQCPYRPMYFWGLMLFIFLPFIGNNFLHFGKEIDKQLWQVEIQNPQILRGIHTDPSTAELFSITAQEIKAYQDQHPGATVIALDNPWKGSLLIQALQGRCALFHPAYWDVENKISELYPDYLDRRRAYILEKQPLLILDYDPDSPELHSSRIDLQELNYRVYKTVLREVISIGRPEKVLYSFAKPEDPFP